MKVVIVGGVAGGATAAARIRRLDESARILIFERSGYISYANCGLPYYIGDVITDPEELTLQTPESFFERFRIEAKVRHEVTAVLPEEKAVRVKDLTTGREFTESYDKLILSPGARPTLPRLPGAGIARMFTLRTVEDTLAIKAFISEKKPRSAVLAGGGFISLELAENLRGLGMEVTIVQRPKQVMNLFDPEMAAFLHGELRRNGVTLALGRTVEALRERDEQVDVLLTGGETLTADMVVMALGVTPDTALAKEAGLELGMKGSILVNDRIKTSSPVRTPSSPWPVPPTSRPASPRTTSAAATAGTPAPWAAAWSISSASPPPAPASARQTPKKPGWRRTSSTCPP